MAAHRNRRFGSVERTVITIVSWNINRSSVAVSMLRAMGADIALLQEVGPGVANQLSDSIVGGPLRLEGTELRPVVAKLSNRVSAEPLRPTPLPLSDLNEDEIAISDPTTLAVAHVTPLADDEPSEEGEGPAPRIEEPFIVVSMYARWLKPHPLTARTRPAQKPGLLAINVYADASAHRIISDLSNLIGHTNPVGHRIIVAGDLNTIYGATEQSRHEMPGRAETIFSRMNALGLEFVGPRWPAGRGQTADVPPDTRNVPTYLHFARLREMREAPENGTVAGNQLDYVFASRGFHGRVKVRALNAPHEWGPSDHCRLLIEVE